MSVTSSSANGQTFSKLAHQEKQVLLLLSSGRSDKEMAKSLFLGEGMIRNYVHSILSKLGLLDRMEATAYALKHDLRGHMGYSD
jgi:DNA-binding NarL/FixJ family response regulator